jgi:hypothetical protein
MALQMDKDKKKMNFDKTAGTVGKSESGGDRGAYTGKGKGLNYGKSAKVIDRRT